MRRSRPPHQDHAPPAPGQSLSGSRGGSHPFILLYPIKIYRTGKPRPCHSRARASSCPTRGGSRPRGDARASGVRAQPRTMLSRMRTSSFGSLGESKAPPSSRAHLSLLAPQARRGGDKCVCVWGCCYLGNRLRTPLSCWLFFFPCLLHFLGDLLRTLSAPEVLDALSSSSDHRDPSLPDSRASLTPHPHPHPSGTWPGCACALDRARASNLPLFSLCLSGSSGKGKSE